MENAQEIAPVPPKEPSKIRSVIGKFQKQPPSPEQKRKNEQFNNQYLTRVPYELDGGRVNTVHIKPDTTEGNPVIYGFGWMGMIDGCKPYLKAMYDGKKETFAFDQIMFKPKDIDGNPPYSKYTERNADAIVEIAKQNGLTVTDLLGHSEGASNTLRAAQKMLEQGIRVEEVVLVNPTGSGRPTEDQLDKSGKAMLKTEAKRSLRNPRTLTEFLRLNISGGYNLLRHRHLREEGLQVSQSNMAELIKPLLKQGVKISILQADDDPFLDSNDINGEVQAAAQSIRQARAEILLEEVDQIINAKYGQVQSADRARNRSDLYQQKIDNLTKQEENEMLITSATGNPGHLFGEYQTTYIPHVVDMLNLMRVRRVNHTLISNIPQLPPTLQQAA